MRLILFFACISLSVSLTGKLRGEETQKRQQLQLIVLTKHLGEYGLVIIDVPSMKSRLLKKGEFFNPTWSPDGKRITYCNHTARIFMMSMDDGAGDSEVVPTPIPARCAVWSPDGKRIAFTAIPEKEQAEVYVMNADGSDPVNLTNHSAYDSWSAMSPDGKTIAFSSNRDNKWRLFVMNADGSDQRALLNEDTHFGSFPAWSPDGRMIVFSKTLPNRTTQIFAAKSDGSQLRQLTHNNQEMNWHPAWSPNGRYIAYVRFEKWGEEKSPTGDLMLFDVVSETSSKVLSGVSAWSAGTPAWKTIPKNPNVSDDGN